MIDELLPQAERIAARLKARGETISVAESSTAGLISAALLAIAGASAYFMGGAVVTANYERKGHRFVELDVLVSAGQKTPIARIGHIAIYRPRQLADAA